MDTFVISIRITKIRDAGFPVLTASSWTGGRDRFPRLSLSTPNFQAMCMIKPLKAGVEIEYHALEVLGLEVKE